jgi:hypothetical protein
VKLYRHQINQNFKILGQKNQLKTSYLVDPPTPLYIPSSGCNLKVAPFYQLGCRELTGIILKDKQVLGCRELTGIIHKDKQVLGCRELTGIIHKDKQVLG